MIKIEEERRFKETVQIINHENVYKNFIEIGGTDASFKSFVEHDSWIIIDKYGDPDINVDLDGRKVNLPFDDDSIECFILTEVLEHLRMGTPLIKEIYRCLKKDGMLIISVPNAVSLGNRMKWFFGRIPFMAASSDCGHDLGGTGTFRNGYWEGAHVVDFNKKRLKLYIERCDFKLIKFYKSAVQIKNIPIPKFLTSITLGNFLIATFKKE